MAEWDVWIGVGGQKTGRTNDRVVYDVTRRRFLVPGCHCAQSLE